MDNTKNIQLCIELGEAEHVCFQLVRVEDSTDGERALYHMDYGYPLTALHAFTVALSLLQV